MFLGSSNNSKKAEIYQRIHYKTLIFLRAKKFRSHGSQYIVIIVYFLFLIQSKLSKAVRYK